MLKQSRNVNVQRPPKYLAPIPAKENYDKVIPQHDGESFEVKIGYRSYESTQKFTKASANFYKASSESTDSKARRLELQAL